MKKVKLILAAVLLFGTIAAYAQPRAAGLRLGWGFEASYQHTINAGFLEGDLGLDLYDANLPGFKATVAYDFLFNTNAKFTNRGKWLLYAGPGISFGHVGDTVNYFEDIKGALNGSMVGLVAQAGIEYTFWFPLQLSLDMRPCFGIHINDQTDFYRRHTEFYNYGLYGFIPSLSVRYKF